MQPYSWWLPMKGSMPQTREHLAILDLLQIQGGVVALTKIDLVDDPEWLDLVEADVAETLARDRPGLGSHRKGFRPDPGRHPGFVGGLG